MSRTRVTGADGPVVKQFITSTVYASYFTDRFYLNAQWVLQVAMLRRMV